MPKEERFFPLFEKHSRELVAGAVAMRAALDGGEEVARFCREVAAHEAAADEVTREVMLAVRRSFITPFDRGDIKDLIQSMDDAIDQMNQVTRTIMLYEVREFDPLMREMGDIIIKTAQLTAEAVPLLRRLGPHVGRLGTLTEEVTRLEGRSDELHEQGLRQLFRAHGNSNPMAYIIGSEVYGRLEKVVDSFEDVADEISAIVIEHV
jgi:predicted phosphate transport protein (TIGR00153 family)